MLKQEYYKVLRTFAKNSFEDCYHGLNIALESDPQFKKYMERNYRVQVYERENDFYLTANERNFHLIGFMDAIICLERMGMILWNPLDRAAIEGEDEEPDEEDLECEERFNRECEAMKKLVWYVETGEE